jgi:hypothetical protein
MPRRGDQRQRSNQWVLCIAGILFIRFNGLDDARGAASIAACCYFHDPDESYILINQKPYRHCGHEHI